VPLSVIFAMPSDDLILVRAECVRKRNEVAIIPGIIYLLSSLSLSWLFALVKEKVIVGLWKFALAPILQKYYDSNQKKVFLLKISEGG
jgi:hypothetical protein